MSTGEYGEYRIKVRGVTDTGTEEVLRQKVDEGEHMNIHGGLREGIRMRT